MIELSIVMPCLNEERTVGVCIEKALGFLHSNGIAGEVVIGDNGSTDDSVRIAESLGARVAATAKKGYGFALMAGIKAAQGRYIIMGDADDSYDFSALGEMLEKLRAGHDLVMGNRFQGGIKPGAMPFLHRYLGNPVLSMLGRLFFKIPVRDFHCGLRGFSKEAYSRLNMQTGGMEFASELVVKASLQKFKIAEVPVILYPDGRDRKPHLRTWSDGWRHLRFLLLHSPDWLFLYPGLFLLLIGITGAAILSFGDIRIEHVRLGIHTLLYAYLFIMVGFHFLSFFMVSRLFGIDTQLFPQPKEYHKVRKLVTLETGLIVGFILLLAGIFLSAINIYDWKQTGFGDLEPNHNLRLLFPSITFILIGIEIILASFILSFIKISIRQEED